MLLYHSRLNNNDFLHLELQINVVCSVDTKKCFLLGFLNVTIRSEGCDDPNLSGENATAFIWVNGTDYSLHGRGFNLAVFNITTGKQLNYASILT